MYNLEKGLLTIFRSLEIFVDSLTLSHSHTLTLTLTHLHLAPLAYCPIRLQCF